MNMDIDIREEHPAEGEASLKVSGRIDTHSSPRLRAMLKPLLSKTMRSVHVALDGVDFMDSSGIATLVEGLQWSRANGGEFVLTGLSEAVLDVFILAKLDTVFDIRKAKSGT